MEVLPCGHVARQGASLLCPHLIGDQATVSHFRILRGRRLEADFICQACERERSQGKAPQLVAVCEGCAERVASETWDLMGWRGTPGIEERHEGLIVRDLGVLSQPSRRSPTAAAPFERGWAMLSPTGDVWLSSGDEVSRVANVRAVQEPPRQRQKQPRLAVHVSDDGAFVAVVNDYGSTGVVLDVATGTRMMRLDRGLYQTEQTPFSVAFTRRAEGEAILLSATAWNRVDAFAPGDARLLTPRQPTSYARGEDRPDHYLDYFHGALLPSPDGRWVLDDGWVWHPVGIPAAWSIDRWLSENPWEAEDGPSRATFGHRAYLWDAPMCWISERLVAIWGHGFDNEAMLDGVTVYDVENVVVVTEFAGVPKGRLWSDGQRLYAAAEHELSVWDPYTGQRTAELPALAVVGFNPWLREFLVDQHDGLHRARLEPARRSN